MSELNQFDPNNNPNYNQNYVNQSVVASNTTENKKDPPVIRSIVILVLGFLIYSLQIIGEFMTNGATYAKAFDAAIGHIVGYLLIAAFLYFLSIRLFKSKVVLFLLTLLLFLYGVFVKVLPDFLRL